MPLLLIAALLAQDFDRTVAEFDPDFCGAILVASRGKILVEKGYGPADAAKASPIGPSSLWDWASVSKQFTAAALLRLQDQKKLKLDDPLSKFFPNAPPDRAKVTLRQLLNHTSGMEAGFRLEWQFDPRSRASLETLLLKVPMTSKPGEKWEYSNSAYSLAAAVVERAGGKPFEEFCIDQLFKPAGMKDATFIGRADRARVPKADRGRGFAGRPGVAFAYGNELLWSYRGCGGVVATPRDFFQWDRALRGDKVLSKAAMAEFYLPGLNHYALGWLVSPDGARVEHGGAVEGVQTYVVRLLAEDLLVALACSGEPKGHPQILAEALLRVARR
jgi:CubicO group peptidase (beta-lactamase class C family)